ncbi:unnamed protein product [Linum trigynum]|uniref:Uncharacterized protein n=1 Tax=Linum trigynum TaxID=586398 RepID=A0AAV2FGG8_9ROSI
MSAIVASVTDANRGRKNPDPQIIFRIKRVHWVEAFESSPPMNIKPLQSASGDGLRCIIEKKQRLFLSSPASITIIGEIQ